MAIVPGKIDHDAPVNQWAASICRQLGFDPGNVRRMIFDFSASDVATVTIVHFLDGDAELPAPPREVTFQIVGEQGE